MGLKQLKQWIAICDGCGEYYTSTEYAYDCFDSKEEAKEEIETNDFWEVIENKVYCDKCCVSGGVDDD